MWEKPREECAGRASVNECRGGRGGWAQGTGTGTGEEQPQTHRRFVTGRAVVGAQAERGTVLVIVVKDIRWTGH